MLGHVLRRQFNPVTVGMTFTRLTVVAALPRVGYERLWLCACSCGSGNRPVLDRKLKGGATRSCGCLRREIKGHQHGLRGLPEYKVWNGMLSRCQTKGNDAYSYYGGRGISVCAEWRESFVQFLKDVGSRPSPQYTLERIDNSGNYEPGNVRWATRKEQSRNTRRTRLIAVNGETRCGSDWADHFGVHRSTFWRRLRMGLTPTAALGLNPPVVGELASGSVVMVRES